MTETSAGSVDVLLARGGGWLVAVEACKVSRIDARGNTVPAADVISVGGLLGSRDEDKPQRILIHEADGVERALAVDRVLGVKPVQGRAFLSIPKFLQLLDLPEWWLGVLWSGDDLAMVLDLPLALAARGRTDA